MLYHIRSSRIRRRLEGIRVLQLRAMAQEFIDSLNVREADCLVEDGVHARATVDVWVGTVIEEEGDDGSGAFEG